MKAGIAVREISDRLKRVYGESALSYSSVRRWLADFRGGRSDIIDKPSPSAGKVMITVFWDSRGVLLLDFLPKGETINSLRYQQKLKKLSRSIHLKGPNLKNVILHHDNARTHTTNATTAAIAAKGWTVLPHPAYSPDLAPSDFHMFGPLKDYLRGQRFEDDDAVKSAVKAWIRQCTPEFFVNGFINWRNQLGEVCCAQW